MTLRPAFVRLSGLLLVITLAAPGCASVKNFFGGEDEDAQANVPVEVLYERAHASMTGGNWARAIEHFERLIAQYPYGPHTEQALMETAYAQYKAGQHESAISTIDRFLRTYPTHRHVPYMYYLRGLVNSGRDTIFLQRVWRLDPSRRDLAAPHQAYSDLSTVVERYPNSRYAADARVRMGELRDLFARHEIETALYYLRRGAWVAAANRAEFVMETYPDSMYQHDAVAVIAEAHTQLGNDVLAADARRVLEQGAPQHPWLRGANWPDYPWVIRKLNPFAGEASPLDD